MANLAASASLMIAVALPWSEVAVRVLFGALLNLLVYLTNDFYDIRADLASPRKDHDKARFLDQHHGSVRIAQAILFVLLGAVAIGWSRGLFVTFLLASALCWTYCARLKRVAGLDLLSIIVCSVAGTMLAFPLDSALGWVLAGQLGLFSACFQTIQMIRDHDDDLAFGTRTTAVAIGVKGSTLLQRALMLASAAYALALVHRWLGLALLIAPLLPADPARATRHWNRVRAIFGVVWLAMVAWIAWHGTTDGLVAAVPRSQIVSWLVAVR